MSNIQSVDPTSGEGILGGQRERTGAGRGSGPSRQFSFGACHDQWSKAQLTTSPNIIAVDLGRSGCKASDIDHGVVARSKARSGVLVTAMSQLQRSAMSARLAKLPGHIPGVYTPTVAPSFATEDENAEEMEEAMSSIAQLPSMAPPHVLKYISGYTTKIMVTDTSTQTGSATSSRSRSIRSERVHTDLRREPLCASIIRLCGCSGAGLPRILYAARDEGK
jgi:hypothetical protein